LNLLNTLEKLHFLHRAFRYRYRSEKFSVQYMLSRLSKGDTVFDIGANRGLYSYWMARAVGDSGKVFSFEPQKEMQAQLRAMKESFRLPMVEVVPNGLSTEPGTLTMKRPEYNWGGASIEAREHTCKMDVFEVDVIRLDDFVEERGIRNVSFVKCDVEGHELKVFQGAEKFLKLQQPVLLFECDDADDPDCAVFAYLKEIGYRGYCFHNGLSPIEEYVKLKSELDPKAVKDFVFLFR